MILIGCDFSCNKPAVCILKDNKYYFATWPLEIDKKSIDKLINSGIIVFNRTRLIAGNDSSEKFRVHVKTADLLAQEILFFLKDIIRKEKVLIAFEGSSFGSKGDAGLQLAGYRYILMNELGKLYGLENIYTYAPLTIKSVAGCATKDKRGKDSMIKAFTEENVDHLFNYTLKNDSAALKKKTNFVSCVDDLSDSYWILQTLIAKM